MSLPDNFEVVEGIAYYRPVAKVSFREATALVCRAVAACHEAGVKKILVDTLGLTGVKIPSTLDRLSFIEQVGSVANGVVVAVLERQEILDPFCETAAANRGIRERGFTSEAEALKWLRDQKV